MILCRQRMRAAAIGALGAGILLAGAAPGQTRPPAADDCKELTGAERTRCEQRVADEEKARHRDDSGPTDQAHASPGKKESSRDEARPPTAPRNDADEAPPDTKSTSDDHSDTADPPQD